MQLYLPKDILATAGDMMLIYGDSGVGKSVSIMQTAPDPIIYIMAEGRDVTKMLAAANRPDVKIKFGLYTTFDDLMETIVNENFFSGARSVVLDSLTHIMGINLSDEILDESFEAMDKSKQDEKSLTLRVKMSREGYGTLAGQMLRLTNGFTKLSLKGTTVITIARSESAPKFNRALAAAPALKGKEYLKYFAGFFDFIGYCEPRVVEGAMIYPPYVSFQDDGSFMSKWTGLMPAGGVYKKPLNITKILEVAHGKGGKKE